MNRSGGICCGQHTGKSETMKTKQLSEKEIDKIVESQAGDDSAWEEPVLVRRDKAVSLSIAAEFTARASFLTKPHRDK